MFAGELLAICIADDKCLPLHVVDSAEAVTGQGLTGDRYASQRGSYSRKHGPDREVTLIEIEAIEALARECQIAVVPEQARRNLVTRGVPLNHLVDKDFRVGEVLLRGIRLCEPCGLLERLTALPGIEAGLVHRGGLRAQIVKGGTIRSGDAVRLLDAAVNDAAVPSAP
jgi:MOSC domain-containing protein YiiM